MPSYSNRKGELEQRLEEIKNKIQLDEYYRIAKFLPEFASARDAAITAILTHAADDSDENIESDHNSAVQTVRASVRDLIAGMFSGIAKPTEEAFYFRAALAVEEDFFFRSLEPLGLGATHDTLIKRQKLFDKSLEDLQKVWATAADASRAVQQAESEANIAINRLVISAIDGGAGSFARLGDATWRLLEWCSKIGDRINDALISGLKAAGVSSEWAELLAKISEPGKDTFAKAKELGIPAKELALALPFLTRDAGMVVTDALKDLPGPLIGAIITILGDGRKSLYPWLSGAYVDATSRMVSQIPNRGKIIVSVSQSRRETEEFVKNNSIEATAGIINNAKDHLRSWADALPTTAMQRDGRDLVEALCSAMDRRMDRIQNRYRAFSAEHEGRFFGPVRTETVNELLNPTESEQQLDAFIGLRFDEKLKDNLEKTMKITSVVEDAWRQIQDGMALLPVESQYAVKSELSRILDPLKKVVEEEQRQTAEAIQQAARATTRDEVRKLYDRAELVRALKEG